MIHRQIGTILVRVDDLVPRDRELLENSIRLVNGVNGRQDFYILFGILGGLFAATMFLMCCLIASMSMQIPGPFLVSGVMLSFGISSIVLSVAIEKRTRQKTLADIGELDRFMAESEKCREFVDAYCRAYPRLVQIMDHNHTVLQTHSA